MATSEAHYSVFVATDDQHTVRKQITQLSEHERANTPSIHFLSREGAEAGHVETSFNALSSAERYHEHLHVLADLRVISSSAVFVCNFRSKFALLAEALRAEGSIPAVQVDPPYQWVPGG